MAAAVVICMAGVAKMKHGSVETYLITPSRLTSFQSGALAVGDIIIAFTGHTAFFGFISELENPRDFPKALAMLQTAALSFYITVAVVIYYYAGQKVDSPALGSASHLIRKIAYGVASPTIVIAGVINAHVCVKNIYVRIWRNTDVMSTRSFKAIGSWVGLDAGVWVLAFIIANAIPVFNQLLGLLGALLCTWFVFGFPAILWLYMNRGKWFIDWRKTLMTLLNCTIFAICLATVRPYKLWMATTDDLVLAGNLWQHRGDYQERQKPSTFLLRRQFFVEECLMD